MKLLSIDPIAQALEKEELLGLTDQAQAVKDMLASPGWEALRQVVLVTRQGLAETGYYLTDNPKTPAPFWGGLLEGLSLALETPGRFVELVQAAVDEEQEKQQEKRGEAVELDSLTLGLLHTRSEVSE